MSITLDIEQIKRLYYDEKKSLIEVADRLGCSTMTVRSRMIQHGLTLRSLSEAGRARWSQTFIEPDIAELVRLYFEEHLPLKQIGKRLGLTPMLVRTRLVSAGYQLRPASQARGTQDVSELVRLYFEETLSLTEIGGRVGMSAVLVRNRLISAGYQLRTLSEATALRHKKQKESEKRRASKDTPQPLDISAVPEGTIEEKILFLRDTQKAKVQDIARALSVPSAIVYDVIKSAMYP